MSANLELTSIIKQAYPILIMRKNGMYRNHQGDCSAANCDDTKKSSLPATTVAPNIGAKKQESSRIVCFNPFTYVTYP